MLSIARRIADAIEAAGKSQREVAPLVGVAPSAVSQWCTGATVPTVPNLVKLAAVLGVEVATLLPEGAKPDEPLAQPEEPQQP